MRACRIAFQLFYIRKKFAHVDLTNPCLYCHVYVARHPLPTTNTTTKYRPPINRKTAANHKPPPPSPSFHPFTHPQSSNPTHPKTNDHAHPPSPTLNHLPTLTHLTTPSPIFTHPPNPTHPLIGGNGDASDIRLESFRTDGAFHVRDLRCAHVVFPFSCCT